MDNTLKLRVVFDMLDKVTRPLKAVTSSSRKVSDALKQTQQRMAKLDQAQKNIATFRELKRGLVDSQKQMSAAQARATALGAALQRTAAPSRKLRAEFDRAKYAAAQTAAAHANQAGRLTILRDKLKQAGIGTTELSRHERTLRHDIAATSTALATQTRRLEALAAKERRVAAARERMQASQRRAGVIAGVGATSAAMGGGALLGARGLLAPGVSFDAAMSKVQALTRLDANAAQLKALRDQSRALGASTSYTATQAAEGQGFLAMAGFKGSDILTAMPSVLSMAKAGDTDLARAADISSNIMSGFSLAAAEMPRVADVLTGTFTTSNTNLEMLGESMKYVAPVAKSVGYSLEQTAASVGLLGNAGIQGSQAGTTLRTMLIRLSAPSSQASAALKALNVSATDATGNLRSVPSILQDVAKATEKMGSAKRLGYLTHIFGREAASGMAELINQQGADAIGKYAAELERSAGVAQRTAAIMSENLKGDLLTARSAWEDLGITIMDRVDAPLRSLTQRLTGCIRTISEWAQRNPLLAGTLTKVALGAAALTATAGTLALAVAAMLGPFAAARFALRLLGLQAGMLLSPLRLLGGAIRLLGTGLVFFGKAALIAGRAMLMTPIGLAITAIIGLAYLLWRHWDWVCASLATLWRGTAGILSGIGTILAGAWRTGLAGARATLTGWMDGIAGLFNRFVDIGAHLVSGIARGIQRSFGQVKAAIEKLSTSAVGWFKDKLGIRSPSRVFASLGGYVGEGAALGITSQHVRVAKAATGLATAAVTAFGSPALAKASQTGQNAVTPLIQHAIPIDRRAPLGKSSKAEAAGGAAPQITLNLYPPAGADTAEIMRLVRRELRQELARHEQAKQARVRSRLTD
ncbi:phage tail tape measure protein [Robbsia andropogonis]|uniref:phage tail tape measure protein n=1 Tax=Robbsia andropogonis TaxID=28092 RepID=UPI00209CE2D3|nr:phage tail tape measure protein [Robbsia andropogonis]MCP1116933.1 phage tail tape measure protein [Robbsia andropogonis]MCP1126388.1 phage tail tape measure protein [Robbsia andropogonis]